ncbi:hypothetical protein L227DRAFT_267411 [Lentinus tigrinus ALCF2SS1-6]|uniref:Secreted protein n=1 Tax=Lentinus tigrinus ALCF2SS1-6 TaxID=1328759 RepID=A0A5C2STX9_9APHY|nr:hypothetical protein L227DRAFT_267411 [Lentinus tigrinus ALCF2SS1-6]
MDHGPAPWARTSCFLFFVLAVDTCTRPADTFSRRSLAFYLRRFLSVALLKVLYCVMRTPAWVCDISTLVCTGFCCTVCTRSSCNPFAPGRGRTPDSSPLSDVGLVSVATSSPLYVTALPTRSRLQLVVPGTFMNCNHP